MSSKRILALILCATLLISLAVPVLASEKASIVTPGSTASPGSVDLAEFTVYNKAGEERLVGSGEPFETSIAALLAQTDPGEISATKDGFFEDAQDKADGIVKLVFDVVGRQSSEAVDVIMVLDESGSMNMYTDDGQSRYTVPCMNPDHYYEVLYRYKMDGIEHNNQSFLVYPSDYSSILYWIDRDYFVPAVKAKVLEQIMADNGGRTPDLKIDGTYDFAMVKWDGGYDFGAYHYGPDPDTGATVQIPKSGEHTYELNTTTITGNYYSPPFNNKYGCFDRLIFAKLQLQLMADAVLGNNDDSRLGYVSFANDVVTSEALDHVEPQGLYRLNGYDETNYAAGLKAAYDILTTQRVDGRKTYVVFVTDGSPTQPGGAGNPTVSENAAKAAADKIKGLADTELYCIGIGVNDYAAGLLSGMASEGAEHYRNCTTPEDFAQTMNKLTESFMPQAAIVFDVIGAAYNVVMDDDHPISMRMGDKVTTYTDVDKAEADGIRYSAANSTVEWDIKSASRQGARLSFYVQLDKDSYNADPGNTPGLETNGENSRLVYRRIVNGKVESFDSQIIFDPPAYIKTTNAHLTAQISSDKEGQAVKVGDTITYTITLTNTGELPVKDILLRGTIPDGTTYRADSGGTLGANNMVEFSVPDIPAGGTARVSYRVTVEEGEDAILCHGLFGTLQAGDSLVNGVPACFTNELVNARYVAPAISTAPQTGDGSQIGLWLTIMIITGLAMIGCVKMRPSRK